jgi:hypothetical protein
VTFCIHTRACNPGVEPALLQKQQCPGDGGHNEHSNCVGKVALERMADVKHLMSQGMSPGRNALLVPVTQVNDIIRTCRSSRYVQAVAAAHVRDDRSAIGEHT